MIRIRSYMVIYVCCQIMINLDPEHHMMEKSSNVLGFGSGSVYNEFGPAILVIISVPDPDL